jgi:hypothetical protein
MREMAYCCNNGNDNMINHFIEICLGINKIDNQNHKKIIVCANNFPKEVLLDLILFFS